MEEGVYRQQSASIDKFEIVRITVFLLLHGMNVKYIKRATTKFGPGLSILFGSQARYLLDNQSSTASIKALTEPQQ
jgi:hypothetical protein